MKKIEPQNTFVITEEFVDDGFTGTNFERPDFKRMLEYVQEKKINLVVTKNLDRLGRSAYGVLYYYEDYFPSNNVRYMTVLDEKVDTEKCIDDDIALKLKVVTDEMYPKRLSTNIKATKHRHIKSGLFVGSLAPYGYKKSSSNKYKLVIDEEVAPIIKKIFDMYVNHYTRYEIVEELNQLQILPPRIYLNMMSKGKGIYNVDKDDMSWKEHTITQIISNPVYIGTIVGIKTYKPVFNQKNRKCTSKDKQVVVPNAHEPIIDEKIYYKCQEIREKHLDKSCRYDDIFKGIVFCGECGKVSNLKHKSKAKKDGSTCEIFSYLCSEANKGTRKQCNNTKSISAKKLYDIILPELSKQCKAILIKDEDIKKILSNVSKNISYEVKRLEKEHSKCVDNITKIKNQIKEIYKDKLDRKITDELFLEIQNEKQKLLLQYEELLKNIEADLEKEKNVKVISFKEIQKIANEFLNSKEVDKELLHKLVKRVELDSNRNLKVQFRFSNMLEKVC